MGRQMWSFWDGRSVRRTCPPRRQGLAATLLSALPEHPGYDRQEGGPQRSAPPPDLSAAYRVAARAGEARARALEGGGRAAAAAAIAARPLHEGASCGQHAISLGAQER